MNPSADHKGEPRVAVVIPSRDGYRGGAVPRLLATIEGQTYRDYRVHLVKGVYPQGKAINQGADESESPIIIVCDDDSWLADDQVFDRLIETLESDPRIGFAGASIVTPPEASSFQQRAARQFPRFNTPVVDTITDSDLACHGCCAMRREVFEAVGGEREDIIRGLDPDLRERIRASGYRVVLAPQCRIYHPLPEGWRALMRTFFRNGFGSAYSWRFQRDSVYETHERLHDSGFQARTSLAWRALRFPFRLLAAFLRLRFMRLAAYSAYAVGYAWGLLTAKEGQFGG
jgi:glycosyltransferase involved in cell wall biosynthesis